MAERNQRVGRLGNILGRFAPSRASRRGESPGGESPGGDASVRSDRSDDSAEAARGAVPKKPPAFKKPSVPPPRPTPVFQFSNPLASSSNGGAADAEHAPSAPPFEADGDRPGLADEPPADFEWNPLRDPYSITPSKKGAGPSRAGVGGRGRPGGPSTGPAMSPPRPDARRARMERARAANEAARGDAGDGPESLRERMERLRRERERDGG